MIASIVIPGIIELIMVGGLIIFLSVLAKRLKERRAAPQPELTPAEAAEAAWQDYYRQNPDYAQWIVYLHQNPPPPPQQDQAAPASSPGQYNQGPVDQGGPVAPTPI
jgi:hypothetical protein